MLVERRIPMVSRKDLGSEQRRNKGGPYTTTSQYPSSRTWRDGKNNTTPTTHRLLATYARYDKSIRQKLRHMRKDESGTTCTIWTDETKRSPESAVEININGLHHGLTKVGRRYAILIVIDRLTKMAHFLPCTKEMNPGQFLELFMREIFRIHGLPKDIITARGSIFTSDLWRETTKQLGIERRLSAAFHPHTDGQMEWTNSILQQSLRA